MKLRKTLLPVLMALTITATSCSSDDDDTNLPSNACFADAITLTQTEVENSPSQHSVFVTFDAKNTSSTDYRVQNGAKVIDLKVVVTTTDGSTYETIQPLTVTDLSAGATTSTMVLAEYGAGKTYQSYQLVSKTCRN